MKKILFCFAVVAFALTGCGPISLYYFKVKNSTGHDMTVEIKIDGKFISNVILTRKYWDFTSKKYQATYTLTITDELIETVGFEEEL